MLFRIVIILYKCILHVNNYYRAGNAGHLFGYSLGQSVFLPPCADIILFGPSNVPPL